MKKKTVFLVSSKGQSVSQSPQDPFTPTHTHTQSKYCSCAGLKKKPQAPIAPSDPTIYLCTIQRRHFPQTTLLSSDQTRKDACVTFIPSLVDFPFRRKPFKHSPLFHSFLFLFLFLFQLTTTIRTHATTPGGSFFTPTLQNCEPFTQITSTHLYFTRVHFSLQDTSTAPGIRAARCGSSVFMARGRIARYVPGDEMS